MIKVLMICHGNICRSTMAEFVLKDMVKKRGLQQEFVIDSAATSREEIGSDIHYGTKSKLKQEGIPFEKRFARQVVSEDYENYDYLICMDKNNVRNLSRIIPSDTKGKISLLLAFANSQADIADPWYTGDFDATYEDVVCGCTAFLEKVL